MIVRKRDYSYTFPSSFGTWRPLTRFRRDEMYQAGAGARVLARGARRRRQERRILDTFAP